MGKLHYKLIDAEIEVPDDMPDGLDPDAVFEWAMAHPKEAERFNLAVRKAYRQWQRKQNANHR